MPPECLQGRANKSNSVTQISSKSRVSLNLISSLSMNVISQHPPAGPPAGSCFGCSQFTTGDTSSMARTPLFAASNTPPALASCSLRLNPNPKLGTPLRVPVQNQDRQERGCAETQRYWNQVQLLSVMYLYNWLLFVLLLLLRVGFGKIIYSFSY